MDLRLFPPTHSFSQVVASFIAFSYQGIHRMHLVTLLKKIFFLKFFKFARVNILLL